MKTIKVLVFDSMYDGLIQAARKDANNLGSSKGAAYAIRKCCRQHLTRLGIKGDILDMDDEQYAEHLARELAP